MSRSVMDLDIWFNIVIFVLAPLSSAQKSNSACFSGVGTAKSEISSAFAQCSYLDDTYSKCHAQPLSSIFPCYCQQKVVNAIIGCENEYRECLDNESFDSQWQHYLSLWHGECDNYITFSPTTPPLTSLTTTTGFLNNQGFCQYAESQCVIGRSYIQSCASFLTQEPQLSNCICKDEFLSAISVCEYDRNKTCSGVPARTSDIPVWSVCTAQVSSFLATRVTSTSGLPTALGPLPAPGSTSKGFNAATAPTGPSSTKKSNSTAKSTLREELWIVWLVLAIAILH